MLIHFCTLLYVAFSLQASEANSTSFFALLPIEVRDKIAYFLDASETDEDFVARTREHGQVSDEHKNFVSRRHDAQNIKLDSFSIIYAYSVDYSSVIRLARSYSTRDYITSTDIKTGIVKHENQLTRSDFFACAFYIAVSRTGKFAASLRRASYGIGKAKGLSLDLKLVIGKAGTHTRKTFRVPGYYRGFISIGFNKQATKVIVHARDDKRWDDLSADKKPETFYYMELLTKPAVHAARSVATLDAYFMRRAICKPMKA